MGVKGNKNIFRAISAGLIFCLAFSLILPREAFAGRSRAGGGKVRSFDSGDLALTAGVSLGSFVVGSAIGSAVNGGSFWGSLSNTFGTTSGFANTMASGFTTFAVTSQVGRAVNMAGNYYGWKPSTTYLVSSIATGATGGFLNPEIALGDSISKNSALSLSQTITNTGITGISSMAKGALIGSLAGLASSGTIVAIDGNRINQNQDPRIGTQIAGMAAGIAASNFSRALVNKDSWFGKNDGVIEAKKMPAPSEYFISTDELAQTPPDRTTELADGWHLYDYLDSEGNLIEGARYHNGELAYIAKGDSTFTPSEKIPGALVQRDAVGEIKGLINGPKVEGTDYQFFKVAEGKIGAKPPIEEMSLPEINSLKSARAERIGSTNYFNVRSDVNTRVGLGTAAGRIFEYTFNKTGDMGPQIAARSLGIAISSSTWAKEHKALGAIAVSVAEGAGGALFNHLADYYALRPGMYIGEHRLSNRIIYFERMAQAAFMETMRSCAEELNKVHNNFADKDMADSEVRTAYKEQLEAILVKNGIYEKLPDIQDKHKQELKELVGKDYARSVEKDILSLDDAQAALDDLSALKEIDTRDALLGIALTRARIAKELELKDHNTIEGIFRAAGTTPSSLLLSNALREIKYGFVEGAVSGGAQTLLSRLSDYNNSTGVAALGYAGTMFTGAARGILWNTEWVSGGKGSARWVLYEPKDYTGEDWWEKKVSESAYREEKAKYDEFGRVSGLKVTERNREVVIPAKEQTKEQISLSDIAFIKGEPELELDVALFKKALPYEIVTEKVRGYEITFDNEKQPGLGKAVLTSLHQANYGFLGRSLAFGRPRTDPENIDSLTMLDYFRQLHSYGMSSSAPDWFERALASGMINSGAQALGTNLLTSMAAIRPVAATFNIQQQRLVLTNGEFKTVNPNPLTIQTRDYKPWALTEAIGFYLPFPSDPYRARSITGKSFLRDSDGK